MSFLFGFRPIFPGGGIQLEVSTHLKIMLVKLDDFPYGTGENKTYLSKKGPFQKGKFIFQPLIFKGYSLVFGGVA